MLDSVHCVWSTLMPMKDMHTLVDENEVYKLSKHIALAICKDFPGDVWGPPDDTGESENNAVGAKATLLGHSLTSA